MSFVGKKYDAYAKAAQAENAAKAHLASAQGGSTEQTLKEAYVNAEQAERAANDAFQTFIQDPEG